MQYTVIVGFSAVFIIVIFVLINMFRKIKKLQKSNVIIELQSEVNELILELNQTTDRNINILEEKISDLTRLLNDVDKRIKILRTESERNKPEPLVYNQLGRIQDNKPLAESSIKKPEVGKNKKDRIIELHNNGFTTTVIASRVGSTVGEVELIISLIEGR